MYAYDSIRLRLNLWRCSPLCIIIIVKDTYFRTCLCLSLAPGSYVNSLSALHQMLSYLHTSFTRSPLISSIRLLFRKRESWPPCQKWQQSLMVQSWGATNGYYNPENSFLCNCVFSVRISFFLRVGLFCKSYVTKLCFFFRSPLNSLSISNRPSFCEFSSKFL